MIWLRYHVCTILRSSTLSHEEQEKLLKLLRATDKSKANYARKLVFDSEKHGLLRNTFVDELHGKHAALLLIQLKGECITGGYAKSGWDKTLIELAWLPDEGVFAFFIKFLCRNRSVTSNVNQD